MVHNFNLEVIAIVSFRIDSTPMGTNVGFKIGLRRIGTLSVSRGVPCRGTYDLDFRLCTVSQSVEWGEGGEIEMIVGIRIGTEIKI